MTKRNKPPIFGKNYVALLNEIKAQVRTTRIRAARAVNHEAIQLYWWFGQRIVEAQEKYGWGKSVVEQLAKDLAHAFPETTLGFSARNLWDMRRFYLEYKDYPNLRRSVAEIPWGQHLVILNKVKSLDAREYYLEATHQMGWTRDVLAMQIQSEAYERHRLAKKQHNFEKALPEHLAEQADRTLKDVYMLETLGLKKPVLEAQLEASMVNKIKEVMLELGYGFTFVGNQYHLVAPSGTESYIDLLFFNRQLRCLVAMELKVGKFKPEYAGKMNYYLNLLDDLEKHEWENPSIGIILCTERNHIDVEYALRGIDKPVGVSEFRLTKKLPSRLNDLLPAPQQIEQRLLHELNLENLKELPAPKLATGKRKKSQKTKTKSSAKDIKKSRKKKSPRN